MQSRYLFIILLLSGCAAANGLVAKKKTYLNQGGVLIKDTVWAGKVRLQNDILVPRGVTLTLKEGCTVIASEKSHFRLDPMFISEKTEILVLGTLNILGKKGNEVRLSTISGMGWAGIIMFGDSSSVSVQYTTISDADVGLYVLAGKASINNTKFTGNDTGVLINSGEVLVNDSAFMNNKRGVVAFGGKIEVKKSRIKNNKTGIIGRSKISLVESNILKNTVDFQ